MAYTPKTWKNLPDEETPIKASDLNHIEQGIKEVDTNNNTNTTSIGNLSSLKTSAKNNVVDAINENTTSIGTLSSLKTSAKTNLVAAINENKTSIGNIISVTTNDNGTAIKFANGIMICLGKISTQMGASNTWDKLDNVYGKEITGTWNFPVAFKSIFALVGGVDGSDTAVWEAGVVKTLTAITTIKVRYNTAPNYYGLKFEYIAIGTWK